MYLLEEHDGREPPQLPRGSPATRWKTTIDYRHHEGCEVGEIPKKILKWNFRIGENWKWLKTQKWRQQKRAGRREMKTEEKLQKRSKDRGKVKTAENWRQKSEDTKQLKKPNTKDGRKLTEDNCSLKRSDKTQVKEQTTKGSERAGNAKRKSCGRTRNKKTKHNWKGRKLKTGGKWNGRKLKKEEEWGTWAVKQRRNAHSREVKEHRKADGRLLHGGGRSARISTAICKAVILQRSRVVSSMQSRNFCFAHNASRAWVGKLDLSDGRGLHSSALVCARTRFLNSKFEF